MKFSTQITRVAAVSTIATLSVIGLAACASSATDFDQNLLIVSEVKDVSCLTGDDRTAMVDDLKAAQAFVDNASSKTTSDILKLNDGKITSLEPLDAALSNKIEECSTDDKSDASGTASGTVSDEENPDADVTDAEASATLDSGLWDLDWAYPPEWLDIVTKYGFPTETLDDGTTIPKFEKICTAPGFKSKKEWSNAILPPLAHKSAEYVIALTMSCLDYGAHIASGLAQDETRILAGKSLFEINPELEEFRDPSKINDWAQAVYDGTDAEKLIAAKKLGLVALLLWNVDNKPSIEQRTAFLYYDMVVDGDGGQLTLQNPYKVREFEKVTGKPYKGEFLVFALSFKGQKGCWLEILINVDDGRFALSKPGCGRPPTAPPGGCTSNCGGTPGCVSDCLAHKGPRVPAESDSGGTEPPAPRQTTPPSPPADVDTDPVDTIDTPTDLPKQDDGGANGGSVSDD